MAVENNQTLAQLIAGLDQQRGDGSGLASTLRVAVLSYLRAQAQR